MLISPIKTNKENKIYVPEHLSLIGYDDVFPPEIMEVPLTTIRQPSIEIGQKFVEKLIDLAHRAGCCYSFL